MNWGLNPNPIKSNPVLYASIHSVYISSITDDDVTHHHHHHHHQQQQQQPPTSPASPSLTEPRHSLTTQPQPVLLKGLDLQGQELKICLRLPVLINFRITWFRVIHTNRLIIIGIILSKYQREKCKLAEFCNKKSSSSIWFTCSVAMV